MSQIRYSRRDWVKKASALLSSIVSASWISRAVAQSQARLQSLPRIGLIIGNTAYPDAPLKNPANDAKALNAELSRIGFQTDLKVDATKGQMFGAIDAFTRSLAD